MNMGYETNMKYSYAIIPDTCCDLSSEFRARFEVDGYLKWYMSTPYSNDVEGSIDLSTPELDEFYALLKKNKTGYNTSPCSVDAIVSYFEPFLQQGKDVLAISLSGKLSAMYNFMLNAKKILYEKYPGRKIIPVDSMKYSTAQGLLTIKACGLRAEGYTIEQNAEKLEKIKKTIHQMGSLDDLFWLASKRRISHAKALFGTLAGIKVLGDFDSDGMVSPIAKISGYKKAQKTIIEYIKKTIKSANEQIIFVAHSARLEQAEILASRIKEEIKPKEVIVCNIYPINGINIGPGLFAAYYFGTEITDLKYEKEIINEIISEKM